MNDDAEEKARHKCGGAFPGGQSFSPSWSEEENEQDMEMVALTTDNKDSTHKHAAMESMSREELMHQIVHLRSILRSRQRGEGQGRGDSDWGDGDRRPVYLKERHCSAAFVDRGLWLMGLLLLQSCSTFILARNERLIRTHPSVVFFLTMLVGAGGNAGNQAAVIMVRALALSVAQGTSTPWHLLKREMFMASGLTAAIGIAGLARVALSPHTSLPETVAITVSLCLIVFVSIVLGSLLPFGLDLLGMDPAHSSTSIQVVMDIMGVFATCGVTQLLLNTDWGDDFLSFFGVEQGDR
jgi:hypothetical protein